MPKLTVHLERCDAERQADRLERGADLDIKAAKLLDAGRANAKFSPSGYASIRRWLTEIDTPKNALLGRVELVELPEQVVEIATSSAQPISITRLQEAAIATAIGALYGRAVHARFRAQNLIATGWWYRPNFNESAPSPPPKTNGAQNPGGGEYGG